MTVNTLLTELTSAEISEWMAFDQLKDESYKNELKSDLMTDEERNNRIDKMLGL